MPVGFLSDEQAQRYGRYSGDPSAEQLARYFHLDDADRTFVLSRRGEHMRLGCALQLGTVRFLGTFLEEPCEVPAGVVRFVADQLGLGSPASLDGYRTSPWRWKHPVEIRARYGYRDFSEGPVRFRLHRWLYALCWTGTDRPSALFDRATAWLVASKVVLPGASTLERVIARVRGRANRQLWRRLTGRLAPEQKHRLEALLVPVDGARQSPLDRLRTGPTRVSVPELVRAAVRLEEVRQWAAGLPATERLPKTRVLALARFAGAAKAQAVARLPEDRRLATLLAFIRTLEATAQDDVLDLFDLLVNELWAEATRKGREARLRGLRDLDAAARLLSHVGELVLDGGLADADLRQKIFTAIPRETLAAAVLQVDRLTRPPDDPYFEELVAQYRRVRRFFPPVVRQIGWGAMPAGQGLLKAIQHARKLEEGRARGEAFPLQFVPPSWKYRVQPLEAVDRRAWTLCLIDRLRQALRRREVFAAPSLRYADPRIGLLDGPAWEAVRPTVCRTLGHSPVAAEAVGGLTTRLDQAYRAVAANLPRNGSVRFEPEGEGDSEALVLTGLDRLEEPATLVALREAVAARLPRVDLPELLLEIQARTGFADAFRHTSEAEARASDLSTSLCAVLLAEACNTGLEPLVRPDVPALRRSRLSWVRQNYLRLETLTRANARLVAAQNGLDLARRWGGGEVASADGLRFVVPIRTLHAGPNPKYFGSERGVTYRGRPETGLNVTT